jgi:hypothetical protein
MGPASSKLSWMRQIFKLAKKVTARQQIDHPLAEHDEEAEIATEFH